MSLCSMDPHADKSKDVKIPTEGEDGDDNRNGTTWTGLTWTRRKKQCEPTGRGEGEKNLNAERDWRSGGDRDY